MRFVANWFCQLFPFWKTLMRIAKPTVSMKTSKSFQKECPGGIKKGTETI